MALPQLLHTAAASLDLGLRMRILLAYGVKAQGLGVRGQGSGFRV